MHMKYLKYEIKIAIIAYATPIMLQDPILPI